MIGDNKHLISLGDYSKNDIELILEQASKFKQKIYNGSLKKKRIALIFTKASTRTRVSFESAIHDLGGGSIYLSPDVMQMGRGESLDDTIRVLERYVHGIIIRNNSQADLEKIAKFSTIPIINGLTNLGHPCQALADLLTIKEKINLSTKTKIAYLGDGNNVALSLAQACKTMGLSITIISPPGFSGPLDKIAQLQSKTVVFIEENSIIKIKELVKNSDVIYTDAWTSMGQDEEKKQRIKIFLPFQVNKELTKNLYPNYIFLHCLPAYRGLEVTEDIIDGPHSVVFDQAENRLHIQKAILYLLLKNN